MLAEVVIFVDQRQREADLRKAGHMAERSSFLAISTLRHSFHKPVLSSDIYLSRLYPTHLKTLTQNVFSHAIKAISSTEARALCFLHTAASVVSDGLPVAPNLQASLGSDRF